jgi:hypothetical protein
LNCTNGNSNKTGSLVLPPYKVTLHRVLISPVAADQWFTMEVIAEGNHVIVKVNGLTTADYIDPNGRYACGKIVLQGGTPLALRAGQRSHAEFRKIEIKELK